MMLLILILMMIAATNYQNSMAFLLTFTLGSLGFNVIILTYRNLTGINIRTRGTDPIFAGQFLEIPIIVTTTEDKNHFSIGFGTRTEVQQVLNIVLVLMFQPVRGVSHIRWLLWLKKLPAAYFYQLPLVPVLLAFRLDEVD